MGICMGKIIICCAKKEKIEEIVDCDINASEIKKEDSNIIIKSGKKNNNIYDTIVFNFQSKFNQNNESINHNNIQNKITIRNMNRRKSLLNKYKITEEKLEKYIKFTNINKNISTTTNSFI